MSLIRSEVLQARAQRLLGDVVISSSRASTLVVCFIGTLGFALLVWVCSARYSRTELVQGSIITTRPVAKIIPPRSGIVEKLSTFDGALVKKGDPLASILVDSTTDIGTGAARDSLVAIETQMDFTRGQLDLEDRSFNDEQLRLDSSLRALDSVQVDLKKQLSLQEEIVASANNILEQMQTIVDTGYISRLDHQNRKHAALQEQQKLQQIRQSLNQNIGQRHELQAQVRHAPTEHAKRIAELKTKLQALTEQQAKVRAEVSYVILAPVNGRVTALQVAIGRNADPRLPLMSIVPEHMSFAAEVYAPSRAAGFIEPGQSVRLLYDAFPYKRFGSFGGRVVSVSRSIVAPNEIDAVVNVDEPVYRIRVSLDRQDVSAFGRSLALQAGMTLTANIVLDRRSFLDWLLEPLNSVRKRA